MKTSRKYYFMPIGLEKFKSHNTHAGKDVGKQDII